MSTGALTGELLDGRFRIGEVLGRGAMSDVYRGTDERLDRPVAIKVLRVGATDPERFGEERALLCSLDHPHLVRLHDAGEHDGMPFLVLNLVESTLATRMGPGPLPPDDVARIGAELASALEYLHSRGVVHRDIKPSNVLLTGDGSACLADLGAALSLDRDRLTATGLTIGTPLYLAPEQATGATVGPAADVYSLGLVLLEAASGVRAFGGTNDELLVARTARSPEVPPSVPAGLAEVLRQMVAVDPGLRPSASEVRAALAALDLDPSTPAALVDPTPGAAATQVMGPPTMVLEPAGPDRADDATGQPRPSLVPVPLRRLARRAKDGVDRDRTRAFYAAMAVVLLVAIVAGLASRNDGSDPVVTGRQESTTTSSPTTTSSLPPTSTTAVTAPVVTAPVDAATCPGGCDAGPKAGKGHGKKKG